LRHNRKACQLPDTLSATRNASTRHPTGTSHRTYGSVAVRNRSSGSSGFATTVTSGRSRRAITRFAYRSAKNRVPKTNPSSTLVQSVCQNTPDWWISLYQRTSTMKPASNVNTRAATRIPTMRYVGQRRRRGT
jgi:hypothetical protein